MIFKKTLLLSLVGILIIFIVKGAHTMFRSELVGIKINNVKMKFLNGDSLVSDRKNSVYDIDIRNNEICIPDFRNDKVIVFDKNFDEIREINNILSPHSLTFGDDGAIYVATYRNGRIQKFDAFGVEIVDWDQKLRENGQVSKPISLDIDTNGNVLIADYELKSVIRVNKEGFYIDSLTIAEKKDFLPHCVRADGKGLVYVADRGKSASIMVFSEDGEFLRTWKNPGKTFDPLAVCIFREKFVFVPDYSDSRLHLFDVAGKYLASFGARGNKPGDFLNITNLAVDNDSNAYVVEQDSNRVQKIELEELVKDYELMQKNEY